MALIVCPECSGKVSDLATACPHCGAPIQMAPISTAAVIAPVVKKEDSNTFAFVCLGAVVLFLLAFLISLLPSDPVKAARINTEIKLENLSRECEKMMSDSQLGNERRITRKMCDDMKDQLKNSRP